MVMEGEIAGESVLVMGMQEPVHYHALFIEMPILFPLPGKGSIDACPDCSYQFTIHVKDGTTTPHFCPKCRHVWDFCYWQERG